MNKNKSAILYKQCRISRKNHRWTSWVPIKLAIKNRIIIPDNEEPAVIENVYHSITITHEQLLKYYENI